MLNQTIFISIEKLPLKLNPDETLNDIHRIISEKLNTTLDRQILHYHNGRRINCTEASTKISEILNITDYSEEYSVDLTLPQHKTPSRIKSVVDGYEIITGGKRNFERVPVFKEHRSYYLEKSSKALAFVSIKQTMNFNLYKFTEKLI